MKIFEVVAYHGRRGNMRGFDTKHVGQNSTTFSDYKSTRYGSFFTDNPKFADIYGEVDKYDLRIQNTAKIDNALLNEFTVKTRSVGSAPTASAKNSYK